MQYNRCAGEVRFPSLYDDFFEAARADFDGLLRTAALAVTCRLLREGGAAEAERLLRAAVAAMPGDEELAGLLADTLLRLGRRSEAEPMKAAERHEA